LKGNEKAQFFLDKLEEDALNIENKLIKDYKIKYLPDYIEQYEEDTIKLKELFHKLKKYRNNINTFKKTNKDKNLAEDFLIINQKELFKIKRGILKIYGKLQDRNRLTEEIEAKRLRVVEESVY